MAAQTRFKRFRAAGSERLTLERMCDGEAEDCIYLTVGQSGLFYEKKAEKALVRGQALFLATSSSYKQASDKSSVNVDPVNKVCAKHTKTIIIWVKSKTSGKFVLCDKWKFNSSG